jgi:tryptophanyl-tRNA synthetase
MGGSMQDVSSNTSSDKKPRVLSGVQPTGKVHIGNYIGALSLWAENQDRYDSLFCVVDLHALTIPEAIKPDDLRSKSREVAALYIACGIDPAKSSVFLQSEVHEHAELCWILNCVTPLGWLHRMTQFKSKSAQLESVGTGLLTYPVLQAADILIYEANFVPVGDDQRQHIELTREIAQRFNFMFSETLVLPEALIRETGARIMAFDDPTTKMSKSIGEKVQGHSIGVLDPPKVIKKTIMRAVTDSGNEVRFEHAGAGVLNLLSLYQALTGEPREKIEAHFEGRGYGALKKEVVEVVVATLEPIRERWQELMADRSQLDAILNQGTERARSIASRVLDRVKQAVGLGPVRS